MTAMGMPHIAGSAFDCVAEQYDAVFTSSLIGCSQREVIWKHAIQAFPPGSHILELNCGTGEDALFLAQKGISVFACDASEQMIERARIRKAQEAPDASADFQVLPIERLDELPVVSTFDGVFSNFSGLNCVEDLTSVAENLAARMRPGAKLLLCLSTRFCAWEILHYTAKGNLRKALRRCSGVSQAKLGSISFPVYYPTIRSLRNTFEPVFQLRSITGIGISVPPSYLESWMGKHLRLLTSLQNLDAVLCNWPVFRVIGDHMLLLMERVQP